MADNTLPTEDNDTFGYYPGQIPGQNTPLYTPISQVIDFKKPTIEERFGGLPTDGPTAFYTPGSSLIEVPRKEKEKIQEQHPFTEGKYKLTPVDNPFSEQNVAPTSIREALFGYDNPVGRFQSWPERVARFVGKGAADVVKAIPGGVTAPRDALTGQLQVTDPETGMPTEEAIQRSIAALSIPGGAGIIGGAEGGGAKLGSTAVSNLYKNKYPDKPEAFDRVLPAVRNLETGKISTTKRGNEHADILTRLWEREGGSPYADTMTIYEDMLPRHQMGYYDPKLKQFHPRDEGEWKNIDSPDLRSADAEFRSDTSKPAQLLVRPELANRVLPALKNNVTGEINTTRRGLNHFDIMQRLWQKQNGNPNADMGDIIDNFKEHSLGFYDPKTKEFHSRDDSNSPYYDWDATDLVPKRSMRSDQIFSDTSKPAQLLSALEHSKAATDAGFTTDAYHGMRASSLKFQGDRLLTNDFYSTVEPKLASDYARNGEGVVLPLKLNTSNYHTIDAKGKDFSEVNEKAINEAKEQGKSGVTIHNVKDAYDDAYGYHEPTTVHITFDPSTVRSRFAKFNPDDIKKNGLLLSDASKPAQVMSAFEKYQQILENQRKAEGMRAAMRDPETGKIYTGWSHQAAIESVPKSQSDIWTRLHNEWDKGTDNTGFIDKNRKFISRSDAEKNMGISTMEDLKDLRKGTKFYSDASKPAQAISAMANAPHFYSAVENAVNNIKQQKMRADQWLGTLNNAKGVKPEEMDWLGLKEHLQSKGKEPVTKQEVQDLVNANKVDLKEVDKHNERSEVSQFYGPHGLTTDLPNSTKYSQYQLPGGENYREKLLTLPIKKLDPEVFAKQFYDNWVKRGDDPEWEQLSKAKQEDWMRAADETNMIGKAPGNYQSSHWDEPNVLAHVRMNDRNIEGKKSLHLEEIQSDWHQAGRKKGYAKTPLTDAEKAELKALDEKGDKVGLTREEDNRYANLIERNKGGSGEGVPNAPFKKTWRELVLKRMIREAAEKGYDRLSWTPGEAQAERYDLSQSVNEINWNPKTNNLRAYDKNDKSIINKTVSKEELPNYIGKEASEKLINTKTKTFGAGDPLHVLEGLDLKVGGEGMKGFYDQIIPKALEKISGQKVKTSNIQIAKTNKLLNKLKENGYDENTDIQEILSDNGGRKPIWLTNEELDAIDRGEHQEFKGIKKQPVHYIDIPQSLKDQALSKGFPLFSHIGHILTPTNNPYINNQNDVPYGAGASDTPNGYPVNIDKRIPQHDEKLKLPSGEPANLHQYLETHEIVEHQAMKRGMPYEEAHKLATKEEKRHVLRDGLSWDEYSHIMSGYLKETEREKVDNPPANLYKRPYAHDRKELKKLKK